MAKKSEIIHANFGEMRINKEKVVAHIRKWGSGCTRSSQGRIATKEDLEVKKKRILGRKVRS